MNGTVIAASRNLGVVVLQTEAHGCAVLSIKGLFAAPLAVGDRVEGQRDGDGIVTFAHPKNGEHMTAAVQSEGLSHGDAVSAVSIF